MADDPSDTPDLAQSAADLVVATQTVTMRLLEAEMLALAQMVPGTNGITGQPLPSEEEVEEGFDNMPV